MKLKNENDFVVSFADQSCNFEAQTCWFMEGTTCRSHLHVATNYLFLFVRIKFNTLKYLNIYIFHSPIS